MIDGGLTAGRGGMVYLFRGCKGTGEAAVKEGRSPKNLNMNMIEAPLASTWG